MRVRRGEEVLVNSTTLSPDITESAAKRRCLDTEATPGVKAMAQRSKKYDRQLRIWGEQGQEALEQANVCVLNVGPTGSEALKNLVLGGIGSFTIVDGSTVEESDLGNNFLVEMESLGCRKASTVSALVHELNETVSAKFVEESPESVIKSNPAFFAQFTMVIATQMPESILVKLDEICRQYNVILLIARSYGLVGHVRICMKEHDVIESKPDSRVEDLRLHKPWPELKRLVDEFDVDTEDPHVHQHIPFGVILIKIAEDWKAAHGGQLPSRLRELKDAVNARKKTEEEDNYKESLKASYLVTCPPAIKPELLSVLNDKSAEVDLTSSNFWVMVAALKLFIDNEGQGEPPLDGSLPDMHSFTDYYIRLQRVYQARAEADASAVEARIKSILKEIGRPPDSISKLTIKHFCKNARNLRCNGRIFIYHKMNAEFFRFQVLRYSTLADEFSSKCGPGLQKLCAEEDSSNVALYVLLRAVDHFADSYHRYPGIFDRELDEDVSRLKTVAVRLLSDMNVSGVNLPEDLVYELCRFGAAELHCVAAVIGGIAAQEAIKLLTRQFVPISGPLIFNALSATSQVLNL